MNIPFHRASIGQPEIDEVVDSLKSGWLTTGPKCKRFEQEFADYVGARHAVALNSATAALHLGLEAVGLQRGDAVLVPTMTFAATAEVVRYFDAEPILVDCHPDDLNIDVADARRRAAAAVARGAHLKAIIPVHYGGQIVDMAAVRQLAADYQLKIIEDAAHCCPGEYRDHAHAPWQKVGAESELACYSFYANKCITTGEGGMACTDNQELADRIRIMSLHGISKDAWKRFTAEGTWRYEILAPGFKYNLTDLAAAIGIHQLRQADSFRERRAEVAAEYHRQLAGLPAVVLPVEDANRRHSWHLYAIRIDPAHTTVTRDRAIELLKQRNIGTSVHWIPLHMHPYYVRTYGYAPGDFPVAARIAGEVLSLPIYPDLTVDEITYVAGALREILGG